MTEERPLGISQTRHISITSSVEESDDDPFLVLEKTIDEPVNTEMLDVEPKVIEQKQFDTPEPEPEAEDTQPVEDEPISEDGMEEVPQKSATQGVCRKLNFSSSMENPPVEEPKLESAFKEQKTVKFALNHTEINSPSVSKPTPFKGLSLKKQAVPHTKPENKKAVELATVESVNVQANVDQMIFTEARTRKSVVNNEAVQRTSKSLQNVLKTLALPMMPSLGPTKIAGKNILQKAIEQVEKPLVGEKAQALEPTKMKLPPFKKPTVVGPVKGEKRNEKPAVRRHVPGKFFLGGRWEALLTVIKLC